ncbi:hypothetical protein PB2503_01292 [Parvularcula bermudensis HTCC2503]|uniref:N-formylglutamate amidohydrolase n=1 Tax=Parvularcula bermudensis (strain ATCC BAA-594 / HTCC2503 / KCTC 12087) TaxID=314260 RepID=E0TBG3_PARBH|nr:N-formylglutamate amidohydrolase [Parvularcula bermudensis]ADM08338.1 hypothetical protein PB2503_01292 [Parvularcula bermudensis HTCC2503]
MVAKIVKPSFPGHAIAIPDLWSAPFVFASPHSGRHYPQRFLSMSALDLRDLRRSEDAYVDLLLPKASDTGVPVLTARFPRAFVDVNRSPREIDPTVFTSPPYDDLDTQSPRVAAGFGLIPSRAATGADIYTRLLPAQEGRSRMDRCYTPYHNALSELLGLCRHRFGHAILVDWHSMPSMTLGREHLPDVILGDLHGQACTADLRDVWEQGFQSFGFSVGRNLPYAGGYVTRRYGRPAEGIEAIQIEINRRLYLDEERTTRNASRHRALQARLAAVISTVIGAYETPLQWAAE